MAEKPRPTCVSYFANAAPQHRHLHRHGMPIPRWLIHFGVFGVFVVSVIDASVIPLPLPGSTDLLVLLLAARHTAVWLLVLSAVSGSVLGGYLTWSAGKKGGEAMLERYVPHRFRQRLGKWVKQNGVMSVCTAAILPPPIPLLPFLLAAGALGLSLARFFIAYCTGRAVRYGVIAWLGFHYGRYMLSMWQKYLNAWTVPIVTIYIALLVLGVGYGIWKYRKETRKNK